MPSPSSVISRFAFEVASEIFNAQRIFRKIFSRFAHSLRYIQQMYFQDHYRGSSSVRNILVGAKRWNEAHASQRINFVPSCCVINGNANGKSLFLSRINTLAVACVFHVQTYTVRNIIKGSDAFNWIACLIESLKLSNCKFKIHRRIRKLFNYSDRNV